MVFQHSGAQDFDLGGGFHYSMDGVSTQWGRYPIEPRPAAALAVRVPPRTAYGVRRAPPPCARGAGPGGTGFARGAGRGLFTQPSYW